jgi:hypothetical protein
MKGVEIAGKVGVPVRTVQRIIKQFKKDGNFKSHTSCGRSKLLSEKDVWNIILFSKSNHQASLTEVTNACPVPVSTMTIRRTLHYNGIFNQIAVKKPFLTTQYMSWRLDFVRQYHGWCTTDWEHVCWTDESTFEIGKNSREVHVWKTAYERYSSSCVVPTFKSERTSLMIWGGFAREYRLELVFIPRNRHKATNFVELVYDSQLLQFMGKISCGILMEDGAPVHCSRAPEEWKKLRLIEKLD